MPFEEIIDGMKGKRVRILAHNGAFIGNEPELCFDYFIQKDDGKNWQLLTHKKREWAGVEDFVKNGRHPIWSHITLGQFLKTTERALRHYAL